MTHCPLEYYSDNTSRVCRKLESCPNFKEKGKYILNEEITRLIINGDFLISGGKEASIFKFNKENGIKQ